MHSHRFARALLVSFAASWTVLISCGEPPASPPAPSAPKIPLGPLGHAGMTLAARAIDLGAIPLALDDTGRPHLLRGGASAPAMPAATPSASARLHLERLAPIWNVGPQALPALVSLGEIATPAGTIVRMRQDIDGLPIDSASGGELRVMVDPAGALIGASGALISRDTPHAAAGFNIDDATAVAHAVADKYQTRFASAALAEASITDDGSRLLAGADGSVNVSLSRARKAWFPDGHQLIPAWIIEAYSSPMTSTTGDAYRTVIAAGDGRVLSRTSLTADAAFTYRAYADTTGEMHPFDSPVADSTPNATGVPFTTPYPPYVSANLVTVDGLNHPAGSATPDPWLTMGKTQTVGNNVDAYTDITPPDGLTFGDFRAIITQAGTFDRTVDFTQSAIASQGQQMAGITQLFYVLNFMHDFWYDGGFTEAAGNGQTSNYGRGGQGGDAMLGEAQDSANNGARNNANMATPADGMPGRMQVYVWDGKDDRGLALPARTATTGPASFGARNFQTTANLVLAVDGTPPINDACEPLTNSVAGKIVLADRGLCTFKTKALNIQNAGGVGVLIADNVATAAVPIALGDDPMISTAINIGVLSIFNAESNQIKADLAAASGPISATMHRVAGPDLDGSLDASVIGHEFGHFVHHRLSSCNSALCGAMSEGWADFSSLLLVSRAGDDFGKPYPLGVFSTASFPADPVYYGIRRAPYSSDLAVNALTFHHMSVGQALPPPPFNAGPVDSNNEVHNAGEVWASMLWQGYAALQQLPGADFDDIRLAMRQYVVAGLLMAPTDATPTETRDAVLMAVHAVNPLHLATLAQAYAVRGFGSCAISPPRNSADFTGITESFDVAGRISPGAVAMQITMTCDHDDVLDAGETAHISVPITNAGPVALTNVTAALTTTNSGVTIAAPTMTFDSIDAYGSATAGFDVSIDPGVTGPIAGNFTIALTSADGCDAINVLPIRLPLAVRLNTDDKPNSSATDTFDAGSSVWTPTGTASQWTHERRSALDGFWAGSDATTVADASLTSPVLTASTGPLTISFSHRFAFLFQATSGTTTAFDGGVIEYSTDGTNWQDISALAAPPYNAKLTGTAAATGNPLAGRMAFGTTSPGYPLTTNVTLSLGTRLSGKRFQIRFRIGTTGGPGAAGWEIDDVAFTGIVGTPFPALVGNSGICGVPVDGPADAGPDAPITSSGPDGGFGETGNGGGCCTVGGTAPTGATALSIGVLAVLLRRRRR